MGICWYLVFFSYSLLGVLTQDQCDQFIITPPVGPQSPVIIPAGGSQTLTCRHRTIRAWVIQWYHDVTAIREGVPEGSDGCSCDVPYIDPTDITVTERELIFSNFVPLSAGQFSCRVPNGPGVFNICRFDVLPAGDLPPSIADPQPPLRHSIIVGESLSISLTVAGLPPPTITWKNGSLEIINNGRASISSTGALTVTGIMPYDRGDYSVNITNIGGTRVIIFSVFVSFVELMISLPLPVGKNQAMVTCEAVGYPNIVVEWLDSMSNVVSANTGTHLTQGTYADTLTKALVVSKDNCHSLYTCSAHYSDQLNRGVITRTQTIDICNSHFNTTVTPKLRILGLLFYGTAIAVRWELQESKYMIQSPLNITVVNAQYNSVGDQVTLLYSVIDILDGAECLGGLNFSSSYTICLHPVYADGTEEVIPICSNGTTLNFDNTPGVIDCLKPVSIFPTAATVYTFAGISQTHEIYIISSVVFIYVVLVLILCLSTFCLFHYHYKNRNGCLGENLRRLFTNERLYDVPSNYGMPPALSNGARPGMGIPMTTDAIVAPLTATRNGDSKRFEIDPISATTNLAHENTASRIEVEQNTTHHNCSDAAESHNTLQSAANNTEIEMLDNTAYLPSTNFVFATNPGYGVNIAIASEIETEENVAYEYPTHGSGCNGELTCMADEKENSCSAQLQDGNEMI